MADFSTYKNLELPKSNERYNVAVANKNNMVIDSELHKLDIKNQSQDDLLAATKEELNSEILRAAAKETEISGKLNSEISRATDAESKMQENLSKHISNESNPHKVTKSQLGLGHVDNTSDSEKFVKGVIDSLPESNRLIDISYDASGTDTFFNIAGFSDGDNTGSSNLPSNAVHIRPINQEAIKNRLGLDQKVSKSGDTMTGELHIEKSSGDTFFKTKRTDTKHELLFGVGSGGYNRGIHDTALDKWILWLDSANKAHFIGDSQTVGGKSANDFLPAPTKLTTQDLNSTTTPGFYYGAGGNTVKNKPDGIAEFGLLVIRTADSYRMQYLYDKGEKYYRSYQSNTWSNWTKDEVGSGSFDGNIHGVPLTNVNKIFDSSGSYKIDMDTNNLKIGKIAEGTDDLISPYIQISDDTISFRGGINMDSNSDLRSITIKSRNSMNLYSYSDVDISSSSGNLNLRSNDAMSISNSNDKLSIFAGNGSLYLKSSEHIRLLPGGGEGGANDLSYYIKAKNIQGVKLSDGSKPNISNYGRIGAEFVDVDEINVHKLIGEVVPTNSGDFYRVCVGSDNTRPDCFIAMRSFGDVQCEIGTHNTDTMITAGSYIVLQNDTGGYVYDNGRYSSRNEWIFAGTVFKGYSVTNDVATYGTLDLGDSTTKWRNIYAVNGTIQTSDRNEKHDIETLADERTKDFIMGLKPSSYKMNSGTSGRTHWGLISQDIEELMETLGMDSTDFGGFIKSPKTVTVEEEEEYEDKDENGETIIKTKKVEKEQIIEDEYLYSLRYDEFIAPMIKMMQMQQTQIASQDKKISDLEAQVEKLNALVLGKGGNERENYGTI
ncbi:MAG: pyocin knob domain-containing S74 family peptidase [Clostridium sp.]|nr:pyocin knob domain-containing S74 family peptidase [Clostridium sp.]